MSEKREERLIAAETFGKASDERPQGAHVPRKVAFLELLDAPLERRAATATTVLRDSSFPLMPPLSATSVTDAGA